MSLRDEKLDLVKLKFKSVNKRKIMKEKEVLKLRNKERALLEELGSLKGEVEYLRERLEDMKEQISQTQNQISMIEICRISEEAKSRAHLSNLNSHLSDFERLFEKEREQIELKNKEQRDIEAAELKLRIQKEKQILEINAEHDREAAVVEGKCAAVEKECAVLKKRNNAIMLQLRRKLLETENKRRQLMEMNE
ncbi:myosin-11-like [Bombyx mandarina]|uniref:Myosin-11-like n=1 Tax=Bombyx mandarina TaxID=7092 RepID=A0A6J2J7H1_BOMMA|nr:myosin-11-like [Bombyx mandarina]